MFVLKLERGAEEERNDPKGNERQGNDVHVTAKQRGQLREAGTQLEGGRGQKGVQWDGNEGE